MNIKFEIETLYLKVKRSFNKKPETFYTSDLHFGHKNVIDYCSRPFKSVNEMNDALIRRWNAMVRPVDTVYCLGDFSMNDNRMRDVAPLLNGTKRLVPGNHDSVFFSNKKLKKYQDAGWLVLPKHQKVFIGRYMVVLAHMPYGDEGTKKYDTRYLDYRPLRGSEDILLHGHLHNRYLKSSNCIDVGIDHNFRLFSEDDIISLIKDKRKFIPGRVKHHQTKEVKS